VTAKPSRRRIGNDLDSLLVGRAVHLTRFKTIIDMFHHGFDQNKIPVVCFRKLVGTCDLPLLPVYSRGNMRLINSKDDKVRRRHMDVNFATANFKQSNIIATVATPCETRLPST
jgi:hypothetical protein